MIVPTATNIKMKFPEFKIIDDPTIEFAIEEAQRSVDDTWIAGDQTLALMYLAAHYIEVGIQRSASTAGEVLESERVGPISMTYKTPEIPTPASPSDYMTTPYGTRFFELLQRSFPAVAII
jgi:hypothetical protein